MTTAQDLGVRQLVAAFKSADMASHSKNYLDDNQARPLECGNWLSLLEFFQGETICKSKEGERKWTN
jgi:hypothetical protein